MNMKKLISLALCAALVLSLTLPALAEDPGDLIKPIVGENTTYIPGADEAEAFVTTAGWMTGTDQGFDPDQLVDRATIYEMFWKMAGKPEVNNKMATFPDAQGKWFETSARWAEQEGLTTGTGVGYEGERVVTKAETLVILYRYMKDYKGLDVSQGEGWSLGVFADEAEVQDWAVDAVIWGWISGVACQEDADDTISPADQVKRVDLARMLTVMGTMLETSPVGSVAPVEQ